jgi:hypothetical protein
VLTETVAARGGTVDAATAQLDDPAEVIAAAHRHFVRLARRDPEWAWLVVREDLSHDVVLAALGPFAERDHRRGVQSGRLSVGDERAALYGAAGALLGVMRPILDGEAPVDADVHHAEGVLRLLGLTTSDAAELARRPLPPLALLQG